MFDQASVSTRAYSAQEDQVKIVLIERYLKIIARFNLSAFSDRFGYYQLATLSDVRRHEV